MGAFKPLMVLNGFPLIRMTVQCALDAGVSVVCVVTGREGERVRRTLAGMTAGETRALGDRGQALGEAQSPGETRALGGPTPGETQTVGSPTLCLAQGQRVICIENPDFATTDMLRSIKLGLQELLRYAEDERANGGKPGRLTSVFILPGDVPAVHPKTLTSLSAQMAGGRAGSPRVAPHTLGSSSVTPPRSISTVPSPPRVAPHTLGSYLIPTHEGRRGHPVLLARECFDAVLHYEGNEGLRGVLAALNGGQVPVTDPGILLDADDPKAFEKLSRYVHTHKGLAGELVDGLLNACQTLPHIREHCRAVSALAMRMAHRLNALGQGLDTQLCRSAAALHDMLRLQPQHENAAEQHLLNLGYDVLAKTIGLHNTFEDPEPDVFSESLIVCLADKLVKGTTLIAPSQRYEPGLRKFPETTKVGQRVRRDLALCQTMLGRYEALTGDRIITERVD
jgi:CTP:molybdopterin cytidylyltransferase MocA